MAARSVWKGSIKFSLVNIPCKLYNATDSKKTIGFHQIHGECQGRINQQIFCPTCDKVVARDTLLKGYEWTKGQHVIMTDQEIEAAEREKTDSIEIVSFIEGREVPPIYYSDSLFIAPEKVGVDLFALFKTAMDNTRKVAVGKVVMRSKENLILIEPYEEMLIGYVLYYQEQIRAVSEIPGADLLEKAQVDPNLLGMAVKLIENLSKPFNPADYKDEYNTVIMAAIERKINPLTAEQPVIEQSKAKTNVVNLADLLANALTITQTPEQVQKAA